MSRCINPAIATGQQSVVVREDRFELSLKSTKPIFRVFWGFATPQNSLDRPVVFRQENFDGSKTLKIQLQSTFWILATRQI
jgi:hypothetical protein